MTPNRHGSAVFEFPNDLEIVTTRDFDAPIQLVFDVFTKPEHVRRTIAPFGEDVKVCTIDLRVGGGYHFVFVTDEGKEMSFRGTYLEVLPPTRTVQTWLYEGWPDAEAVETWQFEGWPGVEAVETVELQETSGVTKLTHSLAFRDQAGRDHMTRFDGLEANYEQAWNDRMDRIDDYLKELQQGERQ